METSSSKSLPSSSLLPRGRGAITPSDGGQMVYSVPIVEPGRPVTASAAARMIAEEV